MAALPILANVEILAVNQAWAGHAGFLVQSSALTTNMTFVEAVLCNSSSAAQHGWELRHVAGTSSTFQITAGGLCVDFEVGGRLLACNSSAAGQLFLHNANGTLTEVSSGKCIDIGGKVGPEISAAVPRRSRRALQFSL